ncbi:MAG: aminotransferase class I/II-fold pyridoxal phosphate-dependent enzyme [Planctomycetota bacterium]|nr:MAG: aminotransferase class I/II-fold pyridoxal phosphate-dependent enzyme [Planctomycetota bacterium]
MSDFRSDTVTRPTPAMRRAMAEAVVGDDVLGDDPTVQELEALAAEAFGMEAGLFTPSGSMANLIAAKVHTRPGDEVLVEAFGHVYNNEAAGLGSVCGVLTRTLPSDRGLIDPDDVVRFARPEESLHSPRTALLVVENTHNFHGGRVVPAAHLRRLREVSRERGLALHLDGARIWNAIAAGGGSARDYGALADSLMFCFSKGLGAPIGSVLLGSAEFVARARRVRKTLGGGMRQVGVIAAAARVAFETGRERLAEDHANARALAEGVAEIPGALVDPAACETNILFLRTERGPESYPELQEALRAHGVWAIACGDLGVRFVTHRDVDRGDVERALAALREELPRLGRA